MIGETFSHYRVLEKIGAGGMGVVYKALDLQLERPVALKFLPHDLLPSESDRDRFLREARSASALDHPNIGVIYGIDKTPDGQLFIVMAYYDGQTLAQKLSAGPLSLREALDLLIQIAAGLAAAHSRNIIHRDIKPSNILVTTQNSARIVDFGLARIVATPSATLTQTKSGTLPYMAPEQILGEPVDQRCDVWALSVLLVQAITGSHPFARENATAMSFAILNQPPAAIEALPDAMQPVALRGLAKKPEHRYATAKDLLADLESFRAQLTTSGLPLDPPTALGANSSAARKEIMSRASEPRWASASPPAQAAAQPKRRIGPYLYAALALLSLAALALLIPPVRQRAAALLFPKSAEKHVAVLPFDNIGNDPANEPIAEGLMDSLTSKLSNLDSSQQSLWIVPSSVVRTHKISDPSAAGRDLGANLVVKGSIRRDGKDIQLTVNLIDAKDLRQLGSAVLEDRTGDLSGLQDEAVARLGRLMNINVSAEMLRATGGRASPAAYELYLKALGLMQRYDRPGNLDQAVSALNDAVHTDPQFALGYASLGEAYRLKNQVDPNPRWIEQASAMLERAVQLDNHLPAAYVSLARVHSAAAKNDLALSEFQKALEINPRDADAIIGLAGAYERMGRVQDAEGSYKRAVGLKPDYWDGYNSLGFFYYRQGRVKDAVTQFQRVIELTPDNATAYSNLGGAYLDLNDPASLAKAEVALKKSTQLSPNYAASANLGRLYLTQNRYKESADASSEALKLNDRDYNVWNNLLLAFEWMRDENKIKETRTKTVSLLEDFISNHPQDAGAHSLLATLYAESGLRDKSMRQLDSALALQPKDSAILLDAAESYEDLADRKKALEFAARSLANGGSLADIKSRPRLINLLSDQTFRASGNTSNSERK
ncbi:MAG TPA: protein kinase [Candidatus Acidoferrum sp.]|nr:protein kinase [Candidatus Acidoferrum sp.]